VSVGLRDVPSLRQLIEQLDPPLTAVHRRFGLNEVLFHFGDVAEGIHFVESGEVRRELVHRDGTVAGVEILRAGDHIGLVDLVSAQPQRSSTARATAATTTSFFRLRSVVPLLERPDGGARLVLDLADGDRRSLRRISELTRPRATSRVAAVLLHQFSHGDDVNTTQQVVASLAGVTRQTVSDVIGDLLGRGVLTRASRGLRIANRSALAAQAEA
jgi:CRP/FNR family transcriptional regulator, cyclic AMP receptor protein